MHLVLIVQRRREIERHLLMLCERYSNVQYEVLTDENALPSSGSEGVCILSTPDIALLSDQTRSRVELLVYDDDVDVPVSLEGFEALRHLVFSVDSYDCFRDVPKNISYISCGMNEKDTVSLSSNLVDNCIISVARGVRSLQGRIIEVCEMSLEVDYSSESALLLAFGAAICADLIVI